jgi:hypothetical protein
MIKNKLTPESKSLIKYFSPLPIENGKGPNELCHQKTQHLFTEFFEEMKKIHSFISQSKKEFSHSQIRKINTVAQIPKPRNFNNKGFPQDIRKHIEETAIYQIEYQFSLLGRNIKVYFVFDANVHYNGSQRLPDPLPTFVVDEWRKSRSPSYTIFNAQLTYQFGQWEFYGGCENITGFRQLRPIPGWQDPYSRLFDPTYAWGPTRAQEFYAGIRFKVPGL